MRGAKQRVLFRTNCVALKMVQCSMRFNTVVPYRPTGREGQDIQYESLNEYVPLAVPQINTRTVASIICGTSEIYILLGSFSFLASLYPE